MSLAQQMSGHRGAAPPPLLDAAWPPAARAEGRSSRQEPADESKPACCWLLIGPPTIKKVKNRFRRSNVESC
jgi:hypothetical protein